MGVQLLTEEKREAYRKMAEGIAEIYGAVIVDINKSVVTCMRICRDAYDKANTPYGNADEGFQRWMKEQFENEK